MSYLTLIFTKTFKSNSKLVNNINIRGSLWYYAYHGLVRNTDQYFRFQNTYDRFELFNIIHIWICTCRLNSIFFRFFLPFFKIGKKNTWSENYRLSKNNDFLSILKSSKNILKKYKIMCTSKYLYKNHVEQFGSMVKIWKMKILICITKQIMLCMHDTIDSL